MKAESAGRLTRGGRPITSAAGAMGLMQLMPGTWADMRRAYALGSDPYDPHDNVIAGTAYLRAMYDRFGYPGLFAAYNAGPARYSSHITTRRPLPPETRAYVAGVAAELDSELPRAVVALHRRDRLFAVHLDKVRAEPASVSDSLFAIHR